MRKVVLEHWWYWCPRPTQGGSAWVVMKCIVLGVLAAMVTAMMGVAVARQGVV
ncbi:hypothetical protein TIFTF001_014016 [Ficus carica]|uniref:Uncharacterized protein n=1 Tax=Ficus carica TaxID=3494 RepID=A0AA88D3M5_FICCA|nr:hypothetical protein TIFTF001_014016 [Ficus carica]